MVKHDFLEKNRVKTSDIPLRSSRTGCELNYRRNEYKDDFLEKNRVKTSDIPLRSSRTGCELNYRRNEYKATEA